VSYKANITIEQGTDYRSIIDITDSNGDPLNLTGYTAAGQFRKSYQSNNSYSFSLDFVTPRSSGKIQLGLSRTISSNVDASRYVYDIELTDPTDVRTRLMEGILTITPEVTKA